MAKVKDNGKGIFGQDQSFLKKLWDCIFPLVFFWISIIASTMIVIIIASLLTGMKGFDYTELLARYTWMPILINILYYSATLIFQRKNYLVDQARFGETFVYKKPLQLTLLLLFCAALGHLLSTAIYACGLTEIFAYYEEVASLAFKGQNPLLMILAHVILAPMAEELIFRGMIYRRMRNYFGRGAALIFSSLLFGIYHMNMIQFIYAFVLGIVLGILFEKTNSLLASVLAHMAINLWALAASFLINVGNAETQLVLVAGEAIIAATAMLLLLFLKKGFLKKSKNKE